MQFILASAMRPHALLFSADSAELPSMYGEAILRGIFASGLCALPDSSFDVKTGDISLEFLTYRLAGVQKDRANSISRTYRDDVDGRRTVARRFALSATRVWSSGNADSLTLDVLKRNIYCVTFSSLTENERHILDQEL